MLHKLTIPRVIAAPALGLGSRGNCQKLQRSPLPPSNITSPTPVGRNSTVFEDICAFVAWASGFLPLCLQVPESSKRCSTPSSSLLDSLTALEDSSAVTHCHPALDEGSTELTPFFALPYFIPRQDISTWSDSVAAFTLS
ncbi:hypothetical protein BT96DRAFT_1010094 [Gymnopus androsaceus JB14]|uniref:Uncharacterized protein n=1 Tax=Gymnopus androsaceus JB14 TaxID=1447944 RepID=A0A6A4GB84_9AGAR|nr:hypothetical protein BT96DRAFT_1010094 [Gymnopus androsaceus JB14]